MAERTPIAAAPPAPSIHLEGHKLPDWDGGPARVRTEIPGPRSRAMLSRQDAVESNARSYPRRLPIAIARGKGSYVTDVDGNVFVDFLSGAGVLALGHSHPEVVGAVTRQLEKHSHGLDFPTPAKEEFTSCLLERLPGQLRERGRIHFCGPSGSDAVDAALKLCKMHTGRDTVVSFHGSFHGSTHTGMALSGITAHKANLPGGLPGVSFFPYPRTLADEDAAEAEARRCLDLLERGLTDPHGGVAKPAAVILELIQGEGGTNPAPPEFARGIRRLTAELGIPLIVDEVQTGWGRTGSWFSCDDYGIVPDVLVAAKGLSGIGMPVAVIAYDERLDTWGPGAHIGTFRGNQLAFAAGVAATRVMEREHVLDNVRRRGEELTQGISALLGSGVDGEIRGHGLMLGVELDERDPSRAPGTLAREVQRLALERGLILEVGGRDDRVVRLLPPLNVTSRTVAEAIRILERVFSTIARGER
jgi:diaminobutyrate-2-oxoglutarate transaminase